METNKPVIPCARKEPTGCNGTHRLVIPCIETEPTDHLYLKPVLNPQLSFTLYKVWFSLTKFVDPPAKSPFK